MKEYIEICGTPIEIKSIKSFRIEQKEYIYRPVYSVLPPKFFLFRADYRFERMEPYAAIIEQEKTNPLLFWKKKDKKNFECINPAGRKLSVNIEEVPALAIDKSGNTSEISKSKEDYKYLTNVPSVEMVEALVIEADQKYVFYGSNIHLFSVLDNYNKVKEVVERKKEKRNKKNAEEDKDIPELVISGTRESSARSLVSGQYNYPTRNAYDEKQYSTKLSERGKGILMFAAMILLMLISLGILSLGRKGKLQVPDSASNLKGQYYEDVVRQFESKGFSNISVNRDEDLITGWIHSEGDVEKVTINGDSSFSSDTWFPPEASIVVVYHAFPSKEKADDESDIKGKNMNDPETAEVDDTEAVTETITENITEKATEKATERVTEKATEKATERVTEKATEKVTEKATEIVTEKVTERTTEKATEKVTEKATERAIEKVTEKKTEKQAREVAQTGDSEEMVWIPTKGGKKYHSKSTCSHMENPVLVTVSEAKKKGFTACKRCH